LLGIAQRTGVLVAVVNALGKRLCDILGRLVG